MFTGDELDVDLDVVADVDFGLSIGIDNYHQLPSIRDIPSGSHLLYPT